jgi:hypothetical protein
MPAKQQNKNQSKRKISPMKKLTPVLGLAGVVLASLSASAQPVFQYNDGDLVLDFSKAGSADLEVDIGSSSSFIALAGGGAVPVSGYNISSQLLSTFGGSLDGVSFSVFGTTSSTSADYLSLRRLNPSVANTVPADFSGAKASSVSGDVNGLIGFGTSTGILPYSAGTPADSVGNTATAVVIPTSGVAAVNSFTTKYNGTGGLKSLLATPGAANTLAGNFAETPGATAASDLFEYDGNGSGSKVLLLGEFTLGNNGAVEFAPVPEPTTYGLAAGAGLLLVMLRRQFRGGQLG